MTRRNPLASGSAPNSPHSRAPVETPCHSTSRPLVLVADAQRLFAQALGVSLERRGGLSSTNSFPTRVEDAIEAATFTRPDVVLLDLWIPGDGDALAATEAIRAVASDTVVLHTTWIYGEEHVQASLLSGASGLLPKTLTVALVEEAIHRAVAGEDPVYAEEIERMVSDVGQRSMSAERRRAAFADLSAREVEVLRLLAEGCPARALPERLMVSAGTMRNQIHRIIRKLGVHTQQDAVRVARQNGFIPPRRDERG